MEMDGMTMCDECRRDDMLLRCPACNGTMRVVVDGLWCPDCGLLKRTVSEQTLAMTEVRKVGERK